MVSPPEQRKYYITPTGGVPVGPAFLQTQMNQDQVKDHSTRRRDQIVPAVVDGLYALCGLIRQYPKLSTFLALSCWVASMGMPYNTHGQAVVDTTPSLMAGAGGVEGPRLSPQQLRLNEDVARYWDNVRNHIQPGSDLGLCIGGPLAQGADEEERYEGAVARLRYHTERPASNGQTVLVIEVGHGGAKNESYETGTTYNNNGEVMEEQAISYAAAVAVEEEAQKRGIPVVLSRGPVVDGQVSENLKGLNYHEGLAARAGLPNYLRSKGYNVLMVALHVNAAVDDQGNVNEEKRGTEYLLYAGQENDRPRSAASESFSRHMASHFSLAEGVPVEYLSQNTAIGRCVVNDIPVAFIEMGYMTHPRERFPLWDILHGNNGKREQLATQILDGVTSWNGGTAMAATPVGGPRPPV